jgi:hypothetical protein
MNWKVSLTEVDINSTIESNFVILCGCLPYFRQFFRHHAPQCFRRTNKSPRTSDPSQTGMMQNPRVDSIQEDVEMNGTRDVVHDEMG